MESIFTYSYSFDIVLHGLFLSLLIFAGAVIYFIDYESLFVKRSEEPGKAKTAISNEPILQFLGSMLEIGILFIPGVSNPTEIRNVLTGKAKDQTTGQGIADLTMASGMILVNLLALVLVFYFFGLIAFPMADKFTERPRIHLGLNPIAKRIAGDEFKHPLSDNKVPDHLLKDCTGKMQKAYDYDYDNWLKMSVFTKMFEESALRSSFDAPAPVLAVLPDTTGLGKSHPELKRKLLDAVYTEYLQKQREHATYQRYNKVLKPEHMLMNFYFQGHDRFFMSDAADDPLKKRFHQNQRFSNLTGTAALGFIIFYLFAYFNFLSVFFRSFGKDRRVEPRFWLINTFSVIALAGILFLQAKYDNLCLSLCLSFALPFLLTVGIFFLGKAGTYRKENYGFYAFVSLVFLYVGAAGYILSYTGWIYFEQETCYAVYNAIISKGPQFLRLPL